MPRLYPWVHEAGGGELVEIDSSQLEFRVAGFLSKDQKVYEDVKNDVDVHAYTASILGVSRQDAKADTFKPLYGGLMGTPKQVQYYDLKNLNFEHIKTYKQTK